MAQKTMASPPEFQPYRKVQGQAEKDLARILETTAKAIERRIATLKVGVGGVVRAAQLRLVLAQIRKLQRNMWRNALDPTMAAEIDAALQAGESAVEALTRVAYTALTPDAAEILVRGLTLAAQSGLKNDAIRRKRALSARVYKLDALHEEKVEDIIRAGLIAGLSARELAKDAYQYVSPTTKGGASYAAMRLARTEINNAFHERQIEGATRPGVTGVKWNLSGSHKVPDECNVYAAHEPYAPDKVPEKPHPQCFCFLTYETMSPKDFQDGLAAGDFDDEIDRRTRENLARVGQPVGDIKPDVVVGSDRTADVRALPDAKLKPNNSPVDNVLVNIGTMQGFDALPTTMSKKKMDAFIKNGGGKAIYRGVVDGKVSAKNILKSFRSGDYQPGKGLYGNGFYFSESESVASQFAGGIAENLVRVALKKDARVITLTDLYGLIKVSGKNREFGGKMGSIRDPGRYAAMLGYDAIYVTNEFDGGIDSDGNSTREPQYVVLNRTALVVEE